MPRRKAKNRTGIPRLAGVPTHEAWLHYNCVKCQSHNVVRIGRVLISPSDAFETAEWTCSACGFVHARDVALPYANWPDELTKSGSIHVERFWKAFFRSSTEHPECYWKQCNTCGRVLPYSDFSKHKNWGPLEKQMECRACKAVINAQLNPQRTKEQLHEASAKRRVADMFLDGEHQSINPTLLFERFKSRCFKTGIALDMNSRQTWAIDHILPSRYLYPLTVENAALLSWEANNNKRDKWPSQFYSNDELKELARITGADLTLISRSEPVVNSHVDVNRCVERYLSIRQHSDLNRRVLELKQVLGDYGLVDRLSRENKKILGFE